MVARPTVLPSGRLFLLRLDLFTTRSLEKAPPPPTTFLPHHRANKQSANASNGLNFLRRQTLYFRITTSILALNMADQPDHQMEGVEQGVGAVDKGKGKAPQAPIEESADDDSSEESGVEDQVSYISILPAPAQQANTTPTGRRYEPVQLHTKANYEINIK